MNTKNICADVLHLLRQFDDITIQHMEGGYAVGCCAVLKTPHGYEIYDAGEAPYLLDTITGLSAALLRAAEHSRAVFA